jgi:LPPG:FO 2-phospho-L-lactate transferase
MIEQVNEAVPELLSPPRVVALSGGIGGAKLALGLAQHRPGAELLVVANTGDDFRHLGLYVSPDIDTVLYTLAAINNADRGWGQQDETWSFMDALRRLSPAHGWFNLGDRDLATHVTRTARLAAGAPLSRVTRELAAALQVGTQVLPMADEPVTTRVQCDLDGEAVWLPFQEYFVKLRTEPRVLAVDFVGANQARPVAAVREALTANSLEAVVICPSNPYLSIDPILAVAGQRELLQTARAPVVAVSPLVGGQAIKGPTAKMITEMGFEPGARHIAEHYQGIIDGLVLDHADSDQHEQVAALGIEVFVTNTVMNSFGDRRRLAQEVLQFAGTLAGE